MIGPLSPVVLLSPVLDERSGSSIEPFTICPRLFQIGAGKVARGILRRGTERLEQLMGHQHRNIMGRKSKIPGRLLSREAS